MRKLEVKHPLVTRCFHWINVPLLAIMVWSGLLIYWANHVYRIGFGEHTFFRLFPDSWFEALGVPYRLAEGMAWHFAFMWLFALNGIAYVIYTLISGEWRHLLPQRNSLRDAFLVVLHDLHLRKIAPPQGRYNAAQRIAYTGVILMGAFSLATGLAIYKPVQLAWLTRIFGGYEWARFIHFWLTMGYVLFTIVHLLQVIKTGWSNFRSMIVGIEPVDIDAELPATTTSSAT